MLQNLRDMPFVFEVLPNSRRFFEKFLENTSLEDLNKIPKGFNNNIIWNIGHVVVSQQLLVYKLSGLQTMLSEKMVNRYAKGTKPQDIISKEEVDELKQLLNTTIIKTETDYKNGLFKSYNEYTVSTTGNTLKNVDDALRFTLFHEGLHLGYIMALHRAIKK